MRRRTRRARWLLLGSIAIGALAYLACSSAGSPPAVATSMGDAGLDGATSVVTDAPATFDENLIPPPEDASGGGPCTTFKDCPSGLLCLYPLAEGCSAHGVCTTIDGSCGGPFCGCNGIATGACGDFGNLPLQIPLHHPPCVASDDGGGLLDSATSDDGGGPG